MKYRKKPVEVEAVLHIKSWPSLALHWAYSFPKHDSCYLYTTEDSELFIHTLEGDMHVSDGDYIIRGVEGEFYPCKPDIFHKTYESVE